MRLKRVESVDGRPLFKTMAGDDEVAVRFSETESEDVKGKVRDILTSAYEERMMALITGGEEPD